MTVRYRTRLTVLVAQIYKRNSDNTLFLFACRKILFAPLNKFESFFKALKFTDLNSAGHPSWVSRAHPSLPFGVVHHLIGNLKGTAITRCSFFSFQIRTDVLYWIYKFGRRDINGESDFPLRPELLLRLGGAALPPGPAGGAYGGMRRPRLPPRYHFSQKRTGQAVRCQNR